jgi:2-oxoglutarate dehydrogenase complex dehydrogenase (E1) component-like enzyme
LGSTGVEFEHVNSFEEKTWLYDNYERIKLETIADDLKVRLAKGLT